MAEELSPAFPGPLQIGGTPGADCAQILSETLPGCSLGVPVLALAVAAPCLTWHRKILHFSAPCRVARVTGRRQRHPELCQ